MTQNVMIESAAVNRKQPLLLATAMGMNKDEKKMMKDNINRGDIRHRDRIGEVAGVTAAECAAVCCCCPCAMVHMLVLAVYKVPTGLCKKALKKNKTKRLLGKKKKKKKNSSSSSSALDKNQRSTIGKPVDDDDEESDGHDADNQNVVGVIDVVDHDSEMWDRFYGAGFWRSASQRED